MSDASVYNSFSPVPTDLLTSAEQRLGGSISASKITAAAKQKSELKKVAQDFEAVFISHMLKVMRETIDESGLMDGGFGKSVYTELFDQETAVNMARKGTLGIGDILYKSLENRIGKDGSEDASETKQKFNVLPADSIKISEPESGNNDASSADIPDIQLPIQAPISSNFGLRKDPFSGQWKFHRGIDLAAPEGMPVSAALPGKVISAGYESGYGNTVLVEHDGGLRTRYGHLASINVKPGDAVTSEDALGTVGSTGHSTGSHLHFEVMRRGKHLDPLMSFHASQAHALNWEKSS
jgi:peptidoglycan hydrolase FlgJ